MEARFEQFIRERQYLANVTPATIEWYRNCLKWLQSESPSQDDLKNAVMRMREKGLKATGCNSVIQALNAYSHWANVGADTKCGSGCRHPKLAQLKAPRVVLPVFSESQIRLLIAWKPRGKYQLRLHVLTLFLLDTGCRISEALTLRVREIDFDNLLVTLDGKGRKQRTVPFSFELRKALCRYCKEANRTPDRLALCQSNTDGVGASGRLAGREAALQAVGIRSARSDPPRLPSYLRGELPPARRLRVPPAKGVGPQLA
jgi:integrase/recombinase XerD